jgi:hypothetical protein
MNHKSKSKLNDSINSLLENGMPPFKFQDASVHGGEMLISDPRKWQGLEEEHLVSSLVIPAKAGIHDSGDRFPPSRE